MPSGHSTTAFQIASFVHFRYGLKYATPYYFLASYVVWARVYSKNHYIEDTIVGASIGILTSWLITDKYIPDKLSINTSYQSLNNLGLAINYKF